MLLVFTWRQKSDSTGTATCAACDMVRLDTGSTQSCAALASGRRTHVQRLIIFDLISSGRAGLCHLIHFLTSGPSCIVPFYDRHPRTGRSAVPALSTTASSCQLSNQPISLHNRSQIDYDSRPAWPCTEPAALAFQTTHPLLQFPPHIPPQLLVCYQMSHMPTPFKKQEPFCQYPLPLFPNTPRLPTGIVGGHRGSSKGYMTLPDLASC